MKKSFITSGPGLVCYIWPGISTAFCKWTKYKYTKQKKKCIQYNLRFLGKNASDGTVLFTLIQRQVMYFCIVHLSQKRS